MTSPAAAGSLEAAVQAAAGLPGEGLTFVERLRERGLSKYRELGFPTVALESFRFTNLDPIRKAQFCAAADPSPASLAAAKDGVLARFDAYRFYFVDGRCVPDMGEPLPKGAAVGSLAAFLKAQPKLLEPWLGRAADATALGALNSALFSDGAAVFLPKGVVLDKPLHLVFAASGAPAMSHTRLLLVAEAGACATVLEERFGPGGCAYWTNSRTELFLAESAQVEHVQLQREGRGAFHTAALDARVGRSGRYRGRAVSLGAALSRHDARVKLEGEGAECELDGLYVVSGRQHVDYHTVVEHVARHGTSRELYKGVLDEKARAVFNGLIDVKPQAQQTDAQVYNKNLLLSADGLVNTNPEFLINANDVQCRHGATIGQLSADALFYLRSRGLGESQARALLVQAFASEMLDKLPVEALREALAAEVHARLDKEALR